MKEGDPQPEPKTHTEVTVQLPTVGPRIACKFVPKNHRAIRNRTVRDYYLLVSDPNDFKNRAISRNFTIKSHYLRNFSKETQFEFIFALKIALYRGIHTI